MDTSLHRLPIAALHLWAWRAAEVSIRFCNYEVKGPSRLSDGGRCIHSLVIHAYGQSTFLLRLDLGARFHR